MKENRLVLRRPDSSGGVSGNWEDIMESRVYRPLKNYSIEEIKRILSEDNHDELMLLPLSAGEYVRDWKKAQDICIHLLSHTNAAIRANAVLGLSYVARNHGILDQRIVKPYLLKELRENEGYRWRIMDALEDINLFLDWHIGENARKGYRDDG